MVNVCIRPFETKDIDEVIEILTWSFQNKFQNLTGLSMEKLPDFVKRTGVILSEPFEGYFVAEEEKKILGVMVLEWKNQIRPKEKIKILDPAKYGLWPTLKFLFGLLLLSSSQKKGECYIEHIAVRADARGKGVGSSLLEYGRSFAQSKGFSKYSLHVAATNKGAVRLYERVGFRTVELKKSMLTKWLFDIGKWHYMTASIKEEKES